MTETQILLIEDDPLDMELALFALQENKIANHVQVARDGEEALDFLFCQGKYSSRDKAHQPHLVLLDLKIPKIDGLEVLRQLKNNEYTKAIPVVILTSSVLDRDVICGYKLGANSYIQKPVDFEQFKKIIKELGLYWLKFNRGVPEDAFT